MSYRCAKLEEIYKLHKDGRKALVIFEVHTNDLHEYINCSLISLRNKGFDTSKLVVPKVVTNSGNKTIFLLVRHGARLTVNEENISNEWAHEMGNVTTLNNFFNNNYRNILEYDKSKIFSDRLSKFKYVSIDGKDLCSDKKFSLVMDLRVLDVSIKRTPDAVESYIAKIVSFLFNKNRMFVEYLTFTMDCNDNHYCVKIKVEPTSDSIKLTYDIHN